MPRLGSSGYGIADVYIYALQGDKQKALAALRQAADEGWRAGWRYSLKYDPTLESLHDEPEYQAMVAETNPSNHHHLRSNHRHIAAQSGISRHLGRQSTPETAPPRHQIWTGGYGRTPRPPLGF